MHAAVFAQVNSNASATIIRGISLSRITDLRFGAMISTETPGTVVINPFDSSRTAVGGVILIYSDIGPATFTIMGESNANFILTIPSSPINISVRDQSMVVDEWTSSPARGQAQIPSQGIMQLNIGGTLHVKANQAWGAYSGSFSVTVSYP